MNNSFIKTVIDCRDLVTAYTQNGLLILNLLAMWKELYNRATRSIQTKWLKDFMKTLGKNKSSGKNGISRLQCFLNALSQELSLLLANIKTLTFVGNDHFSLQMYGTGTNDPDFYFTPSNGNTYTLEAKMYFTKEKYNKLKTTTNFHKADYVIVFIIDTKEWLVSRKIDNYNTLYTIEQLSGTDTHLTELILPDVVTTIQFYVEDGADAKLADRFDDEVPDTVYYNIYTNKVTTIVQVA